MELEKKFLADLLDDIEHNRLVLPILPEVAIKVRKVVENPDASAAQISKVVAIDAALSARLIQVANSPLLRGRVVVDNLQSAVARLGNAMVRNLVTSFMVGQLYQGQSALVKARLQAVWQHSTQVAAISHTLAAHFTTLKPDEAMLGGLTHDIGALPILTRAQKYPELLNDEVALNRIVATLHTQVGKAILEAWSFPPELVAVAAEHENLERNIDQPLDYADVVLVANLQSYIGANHPHAHEDWSAIPAFAKLGLSPEVNVVSMEETAEDVKEVQRILTS